MHTKLPSSVQQYQCPTGRGCATLNSQHELLTHLQKIHQTTVTQYYCGFGEKIKIKFCDKSVTALVIPKSSDLLELFFIVKIRGSEADNGNTDLCWIWYLGDESAARRFDVRLDSGTVKWRGAATSLKCGISEILKSNKFMLIDISVTDLFVEIK